MNLRDPESMNAIIGKVLRYGVLLSAAVILFGTLLLVAHSGIESAGSITYLVRVPHDGIDTSFQALVGGLGNLTPFSWIELGVILLIATPVSRVLISNLLFATERDRLYVIITSAVLILLLFSLLATPFIPGFHA